MTRRSGAVSVAELVLAFWLFAFVLAGAARFLAGYGRLAATQQELVRLREARRAATIILEGDLRFVAVEDVLASGGDSVRVRAFRGGGAVCSGGGRELFVRYSGVRWPDAAKDSLLLITTDGTRGPSAVESVAGSDRCGPGSLRLILDRAPDAGRGLALIFETGTYHVTDGALRYRRGQAGRQPLTEAVFHPATLVQGNPGVVTLRLRPHPDSLPRIARPWPDLTIRSLNSTAP